eukprot:CAMPEP_0115199208 /NCGR_PEP_ID=MMETSP0270-20121206/16498_1 /TAXON_ID=71861 /ORGANISM="Scrippsiella trochoidea, Strain CCMP3099" /LENGTH=33 /DNA_ID= /DNA_START= /DNA_END= /DNA_ORIENTATION=
MTSALSGFSLFMSKATLLPVFLVQGLTILVLIW